MGAGASSEDEKDTDKGMKFRLKDDLKRREQEIAVLKQKVGNLKSDLIRERQKKEKENFTNITSTASMIVHSKLKIFWYEDYHSFRVLWLGQELEALKLKIEHDFEFVPDIHGKEPEQIKEDGHIPKGNTTDRENTQSTESSQNNTQDPKKQKKEESNKKRNENNRNANTTDRESSKVSKSSQNSHAKTATGRPNLARDKQDSNLSKSQDVPIVNPYGTVLALVGSKFTPMLESSAICMYMAEKYGKLVPAIKYRSQYYDIIMFAVKALDAMLDVCIEYWINENKATELEVKMQSQFSTCMEYLSSRLEETYVCGKSFTVADCVIGCNLFYLDITYQKPNLFKKYPKVLEYLNELKLRDAFISSLRIKSKLPSPDY